MPSMQSVIGSFAFPELTVYKAHVQSGYMRNSIDLYDAASGRLIRSTPWYERSSFYNQYTFLFIFKHNSTDLILPLTPGRIMH
jgi:hypothetical protein